MATAFMVIPFLVVLSARPGLQEPTRSSFTVPAQEAAVSSAIAPYLRHQLDRGWTLDERSHFWDPAKKRSRDNLVCGEQAVLGNLAYLGGANPARWEIWDGMKALGYLLTLPEVDGRRIAITGTSGGGFQAAHIRVLDTRIQVIIPSCYISSLPMRMANRIFRDPDSDPEQDLFEMVSGGIDHPGLLALPYPRLVFAAAATEDCFPIEGTRRTMHGISGIYRRLGMPDRTTGGPCVSLKGMGTTLCLSTLGPWGRTR